MNIPKIQKGNRKIGNASQIENQLGSNFKLQNEADFINKGDKSARLKNIKQKGSHSQILDTNESDQEHNGNSKRNFIGQKEFIKKESNNLLSLPTTGPNSNAVSNNRDAYP